VNRGVERIGRPEAGTAGGLGGAGWAGATPILAFLDSLPRHLSIEVVDELFIFPPRRVGSTQSVVVVISAFDGTDGRRRVLTARYVARHDRRGKAQIEESIVEHGVAPPDRIGRLIDGVLRRLDEELASAPPYAARVGGDPERWNSLRDKLAAEAAPPLPL
jgi:hypothetical protein